MLRFFRRPLVIIASTVGIFLGVLLALAAEQFDHLTSTDRFCTSCHAMQLVAEQDVYKRSIHRTTTTGIQAGCADCHVPKGLLPATWAHIRDGTWDLYVELTTDFTPQSWESRRTELAYGVRDKMLDNDSRTCRSCHEAAAIKPRRERGQRQHELAERNQVSCIGCHFDLVHVPVTPRESFLRKVRVEAQR
ncbi:MAG: hypothetical protein BMS9Abin36_1989 [Gammaproteobacteria bacterium]|nr:MAG: hypothetical protein BMS9Abin36_1989 [Gammaproteobacteria bacterium]